MAYDELRTSLIELSSLLDDVAETHWAAWASQTAAQLADDSIGPDVVRRAFGGSGTLNDLVIHPLNGHRVDGSSLDSVNTRLRRLTTRLYSLSVVGDRDTDEHVS